MAGMRCTIRGTSHRHGQWCFPSIDGEVEDCGHPMVAGQGDEHERYSRTASAGTELQLIARLHGEIRASSTSSCRVRSTHCRAGDDQVMEKIQE